MKALSIALAAAVLASAGPAAAQTAGDARCIILSNVFAKQAKDADAQKAAEATLYFYLGRIGAAATAPHMKTLLEAQAKTITDANAGPLMNDCAKAVQGKVQLLQSLSPPQAQTAAPAATPPAAKPAQPQGR